MHLTVTVKPNAKETTITEISPANYRVTLKAPPQDGKANAELIRVLAKHLHIPQSHITITQGATTKTKHIEVH
jgi:uncharacterized protein (TIGR00251 family)